MQDIRAEVHERNRLAVKIARGQADDADVARFRVVDKLIVGIQEERMRRNSKRTAATKR